MGCKFNTAIVKWTGGCLDLGCHSVGPSAHSVILDAQKKMHKKSRARVFASGPTVQGYGELIFEGAALKDQCPPSQCPLATW
jgi:hypothetical protein